MPGIDVRGRRRSSPMTRASMQCARRTIFRIDICCQVFMDPRVKPGVTPEFCDRAAKEGTEDQRAGMNVGRRLYVRFGSGFPARVRPLVPHSPHQRQRWGRVFAEARLREPLVLAWQREKRLAPALFVSARAGAAAGIGLPCGVDTRHGPIAWRVASLTTDVPLTRRWCAMLFTSAPSFVTGLGECAAWPRPARYERVGSEV